MKEEEVLKILAILLEDQQDRNRNIERLLQQHNEITIQLLQEIQTHRRDVAVWWVVAMLVIIGSFWSYL